MVSISRICPHTTAKELYFWPNGYNRPPKIPITAAIKLFPDDPRIITLVKEYERLRTKIVVDQTDK